MAMTAAANDMMLKQKLNHHNGCHVQSNVKVMLTVYFDSEGVVHHEFLPQGKTVTKEYFLEIMKSLHEVIRKERPDAWR
jgi:hypothetical protein